MTLTWADLLDEVTATLRAAGRVDGAADARRIVAQAAGRDVTEVWAHLGEAASVLGVAQVDEMASRRAHGEPLQYVLGGWGFRSLDLYLDARVLIPRPETEQLVEVALAEFDRQRASRGTVTDSIRVLDLGTGSGAIALSFAVERVVAEIWAVERSVDALAVARANLAGIGRSAARVRLLAGSWFEPLPGDLVGSFDVIVANPPYVRDDDALAEEVQGWEPAAALRGGSDGRRDLDHIVLNAARWLAADGSLVLEMDPRQAGSVADLMTESGFAQARVHRDLAGRERIVAGRRGPT